MSTPTIGSNKDSQINSEFQVYLDYLQKNNLKHSYINFQDNRIIHYNNNKTLRDLIKVIGINNERFRSQAIENLSKKSSYSQTIEVITLGKDSRFYLQSDMFENSFDNKYDFLDVFLKKLFEDNNQGFYFSQKWLQKNQESIRLTFRQLIDILFSERNILSPEEKRNFIEICYFYLLDNSLDNLYSLNLTCKDGIDRAGSAHAMVYFMTLLFDIINQKIDIHQFELKLKKMYGVFFADALSVKKREIINSRFVPFQNAAIFLLDKIYNDLSIANKLYKLSHFENLEL